MIHVLLAGNAGLGPTQDHQRQMYAPAFEAHPGFELVEFPTLAEGLASDEVDLVSVCVPLDERVETLTRIANAGKHALVDKPLAGSAADLRTIDEAFKQAGTICLPAHHLRYHPTIQSTSAAIAGGRIGLPWNVQGDFLVAGGDPCPAGELVNFALYPIDVLRAMTGLAVRKVWATGGTFWHDDSPDDLAVICLDLDHDVTATLTVGRTATKDESGFAVHRYRVSGSHGVLLVDAAKPALTVRNEAGKSSRWLGQSTVTRMLDDLQRAIETGSRPAVGPQDALATQQVVEAAQESIAKGVPIHLEEVS
ncbi:Gfo/Idh/MocA family protein [Tenggerimyces flavus]|uniref:Gfo/Idh/MocA family protein n=1 Tax=Tenggerimyces flavus TaxID=1708749 RepID=A0ABV7YEK0_9ACTN|nr:Gfo/Idh/MocA family oxidoreductase [Tenggerimyces flavus]MBM7788112.1 putative dehydrogenase [Tenggerimyces flavus]